MREAENIREVEALGIDMMGFIFWPKSSRYVSQRPDYLPTKCKRVGVFVDEDPEQVKRLAAEYRLDYIQSSISLQRKTSYRHSPTKDSSMASSSMPKANPWEVMARSSTGVSSMPIRAPRPSCSVVASVQTTQSGLMPFIILSASASISTPASNSLQVSKTSQN